MTELDVKKIFSSNFKRLRKERKLDQKEVAEALDVSSSIVSDWEKGNKLPRGGALIKISEFFGIQQNELFIEHGVQFSSYKEMVNIPIVGRISCGSGNIAYEDIEGYETTPKDWLNGGDYFYLKAKGESMTGARIYEGDLLLIRRQEEVENGEIAAVMIDDEAVLKRVYVNGDQLVLQSENAAYPPIFCSMGEVRIIGKLKMNVIKY